MVLTSAGRGEWRIDRPPRSRPSAGHEPMPPGAMHSNPSQARRSQPATPGLSPRRITPRPVRSVDPPPTLEQAPTRRITRIDAGPWPRRKTPPLARSLRPTAADGMLRTAAAVGTPHIGASTDSLQPPSPDRLVSDSIDDSRETRRAPRLPGRPFGSDSIGVGSIRCSSSRRSRRCAWSDAACRAGIRWRRPCPSA